MSDQNTEAAPSAPTTSTEGSNLLASANVNISPQDNVTQTGGTPSVTQSKDFWISPDGKFTEGWQKNLPEDLRNEKSLQSFKDINGVMRTLTHQARMVGAEKLAIPGKDAKAGDWDKVWDKLGRPSSPDKYELKDIEKLPEGMPYDYESEKAFMPLFHKAGITQAQAKEIIAGYRQTIGSQLKSYEQTQATQREEAIAALKGEYGQAFEQKIGKAQLYVRNVAGENAEAIIEKYGNDPIFIRFAVDASKAMQEDSVAMGKSATVSQALSPQEAQAEINEIRAEAARDRSHPLNGNKNHPRYADVQARWTKLHQWRSGAK